VGNVLNKATVEAVEEARNAVNTALKKWLKPIQVLEVGQVRGAERQVEESAARRRTKKAGG
jgi:hypothetical protein